MVSVADILQHIAQEVGCSSSAVLKSKYALQRTADKLCIHLLITKDVEHAELAHLYRYGHGHTIYFRIKSYKQGRQLAEGLFETMQDVHPAPDLYDEMSIGPDERLYLFIHVRDTSYKAAPPSFKLRAKM